jgi:hypothetical protein
MGFMIRSIGLRDQAIEWLFFEFSSLNASSVSFISRHLPLSNQQLAELSQYYLFIACGI